MQAKDIVLDGPLASFILGISTSRAVLPLVQCLQHANVKISLDDLLNSYYIDVVDKKHALLDKVTEVSIESESKWSFYFTHQEIDVDFSVSLTHDELTITRISDILQTKNVYDAKTLHLKETKSQEMMVQYIPHGVETFSFLDLPVVKKADGTYLVGSYFLITNASRQDVYVWKNLDGDCVRARRTKDGFVVAFTKASCDGLEKSYDHAGRLVNESSVGYSSHRTFNLGGYEITRTEVRTGFDTTKREELRVPYTLDGFLESVELFIDGNPINHYIFK